MKKFSLRQGPIYLAMALVAVALVDVFSNWREGRILHAALTVLLSAALVAVCYRLSAQLRQRMLVESQLLEAQAQVQELKAKMDGLALDVGLVRLQNRREFDLALDDEISLRIGTPLALILIDIDYFELYNETYGHPKGDECLRIIGQKIRDFVTRPGDIAARVGGEEFAILLPNTDEAGAVAVAEKICNAIQMMVILHESAPAGMVTASAGVAVLGPDDMSATPTLFTEQAQGALTQSKKNGRNMVTAYRRSYAPSPSI